LEASGPRSHLPTRCRRCARTRVRGPAPGPLGGHCSASRCQTRHARATSFLFLPLIFPLGLRIDGSPRKARSVRATKLSRYGFQDWSPSVHQAVVAVSRIRQIGSPAAVVEKSGQGSAVWAELAGVRIVAPRSRSRCSQGKPTPRVLLAVRWEKSARLFSPTCSACDRAGLVTTLLRPIQCRPSSVGGHRSTDR